MNQVHDFERKEVFSLMKESMSAENISKGLLIAKNLVIELIDTKKKKINELTSFV